MSFYDRIYGSSSTQKINYQLVDNEFPGDTKKLQDEIEMIFLVKNTKFIQKRPGSKNRFIEIEIPAYTNTEEILNLGKRISIIEQKEIAKCKEYYGATVTRAITTQQLTNLNKIHDILEPHYKDKFASITSDITISVFENLKKIISITKKRNQPKKVLEDVSK